MSNSPLILLPNEIMSSNKRILFFISFSLPFKLYPPLYTSLFYRPMGHNFISKTNVIFLLDIGIIFANHSRAPTIERHKYLLLKYTPTSRRIPQSRLQNLLDIFHDFRNMSEISNSVMILFLEYLEIEFFLSRLDEGRRGGMAVSRENAREEGRPCETSPSS